MVPRIYADTIPAKLYPAAARSVLAHLLHMHQEGRAACEAAWVLDGRFLKLEYRATFNGRPLEVVRYLGFDRHRDRFVEIHFESTHTDVLNGEGTLGPDGRTITSHGWHVDVLAGRPAPVRTVTTFDGADAFSLDMHYLDEAGRAARTVTLKHDRRSP